MRSTRLSRGGTRAVQRIPRPRSCRASLARELKHVFVFVLTCFILGMCALSNEGAFFIGYDL